MDYALSLFAFLAAIVGIVGKTWDRGRPTPIGWVALVSVLLAFLFSVAQHYNDRREAQKIKVLACLQVLRGTSGLIAPFAILVADVDLRKKAQGTGATPLSKRIKQYLSLKDTQLAVEGMKIFGDLPLLLRYTEILKRLNLNDYTMVLNRNRGPRWRELFETTAIKGIRELDAVLSSYSSVMDSIEIQAIQQLRNVWLTQRIENLSKISKTISLYNFLKVNKKTNKQNQKNIYEEFLESAKNTTKICS